MSALLPVSVVMSVHENAGHVAATIDSVLAQQGVEFEFVVVDDGATDAVKRVLSDYNSDPRIRILSQTNLGLTRALIRGCERAKHPLIARIDAGDLMLPDRLRTQSESLIERTDIGALTSWVEMRTEEGYLLYEIRLSRMELEAGATARTATAVITPVHASVMFRKSVYQQVGGYREQFYFAQDCDLWSRMVEHSGIDVVEQVLTHAIFSNKGISAHYRAQQIALKSLIAEANTLRANHQSEAEVLVQALAIKPRQQPTEHRRQNFAGDYFIAKCLTKNGSIHAREYWWRACKSRPWSLWVWAHYLHSLFLRKVV